MVSPPTVLVVKAGDHVFGGFAADSWNLTGAYGGDARSFLFAVTRDVKLPYTGRIKGPEQASDRLLAQQAMEAYGRERDQDERERAVRSNELPQHEPPRRHAAHQERLERSLLTLGGGSA